VFLQKSVQGVEKKGLESQKERQERRKNLQEYENNKFTTEATENAEKAGGEIAGRYPHPVICVNAVDKGVSERFGVKATDKGLTARIGVPLEFVRGKKALEKGLNVLDENGNRGNRSTAVNTGPCLGSSSDQSPTLT
jgi:hypothetical protein